MSLQAYYDEFKCGFWADPDPARCRCHGSGWALSDLDTFHECPEHYCGQLHPEVGCNYDSDWDREVAEAASRQAWAMRKNPKLCAPYVPPVTQDGDANDPNILF